MQHNETERKRDMLKYLLLLLLMLTLFFISFLNLLQLLNSRYISYCLWRLSVIAMMMKGCSVGFLLCVLCVASRVCVLRFSIVDVRVIL